MTIITEFLLARIAEDEELAHAADGSRWRGEDKGITFDIYSDKFDDGEAMARLEADTRANQDHIVNWSPPRVLAECAAKRAIADARHEDDTCIRILAAVYSDHPDYKKAWRAV